jgi:hypothetical protein
MSTEAHKSGHGAGKPPEHTDVSFEARDVRTSSVFAFLVYMAIAIVGSFVIAYFVLSTTKNMAEKSYTPPPPVRENMGATLPPEPRLQGVPGHQQDPQQDLRDKIQQDSEANEKLGWIDEETGIAQIPVKDAMKLIAEKGLSAAPAPPADRKK